MSILLLLPQDLCPSLSKGTLRTSKDVGLNGKEFSKTKGGRIQIYIYIEREIKNNRGSVWGWERPLVERNVQAQNAMLCWLHTEPDAGRCAGQLGAPCIGKGTECRRLVWGSLELGKEEASEGHCQLIFYALVWGKLAQQMWVMKVFKLSFASVIILPSRLFCGEGAKRESDARVGQELHKVQGCLFLLGIDDILVSPNA